MNIHPMWNTYPTLSKELTTTLRLMEQAVQIDNQEIQAAVHDMIHSGGKLLRPAYQLLFSYFGEQRDPKKATALAASIELLHTATLVHDDIVDEADTRRGLPTLRSRFGNSTAVYTGDYLFVCCFKLLSDYSSSLKSIQLNSRSMEKVLTGELGQMDNRYNFEVTIDQYLKNISGKTAELFALSCFVGAYESGTSQRFAKRCGEIGENIGLAFQIIDDILDYTQTADAIGKPVLEDVRQGVYSLPLIYALEANREVLLPLLMKKEALTNEETQEIYRLVHELGGVEKAQQLATHYTEKALKEISKLPETKAQAKEQLYEITQTILTREN
ncbi:MULTISPECIES: polyprenyl synthetase family protein [Enterococcus]|uniref:polyprenyl synthetase family protein n=1 Tax=Enterococcus TaxID=1350 RepID=UPI0001B2B8E1|nr:MULTISPECIES: polyprenyl synthetase family protein [Enterococcus]ETJ09491.1 MAG: Trans-hexaprenyltranstransferase [Enterococcus faecalis DORA_14]HAP3747926.1 polyprenyl synthetase family protein [Enterococcus faecalis TDR28]HAP3753684.1 polyprenyl synthetase family protein [Enterococcus faecalis TDR22]HAP3756707.1 polyprenyl synthetase family protein [Enterococcus faecalis TDR13]HAP3759689.1 polyprenyl synthetase family protein [Enterococcus faecalis TDR7]HAP3770836.1 polyprenyl synthetase